MGRGLFLKKCLTLSDLERQEKLSKSSSVGVALLVKANVRPLASTEAAFFVMVVVDRLVMYRLV